MESTQTLEWTPTVAMTGIGLVGQLFDEVAQITGMCLRGRVFSMHSEYVDALICVALTRLSEELQAGASSVSDLITCADRIQDCRHLSEMIRGHLAMLLERLSEGTTQPAVLVAAIQAAIATVQRPQFNVVHECHD